MTHGKSLKSHWKDLICPMKIMYGHLTQPRFVDGAQSLHVSFISREDKMYKKVCVVCEKKFNTNHPNYLCCSKKCTNINKVNRRYERENGNWEYYFKHLLSKKENCKLTIDELLSILQKQNYKCALSGAPLTCERTR